MHNFILFAFLFDNIRIRFDEFSNDQFLARKNVKKTTSFSLFQKAEMIHFQPIRIHRNQYKYLDDQFHGTNKKAIKETTALTRNTFTNHTKYKFDQTAREVFESTLEEALGSADFSGHLSTSDLDKYADFITTAIHTADDKAIPTSKSVRPESNPISNET